MKTMTVFLIVFLASVGLTFACFINNCPPGGKRSVPEPPSDSIINELRECAPCGPPGKGGRCYGPDTCCSPEFACFVGTPETYVCLKESRHNPTCMNSAIPCVINRKSENFAGFCTAEGVCCSSDTCEMDDKCHFGEPQKQIPIPPLFNLDSEQPLLKSRRLEDIYTLPSPKLEDPMVAIVHRFKLSVQRHRLDKRKNQESQSSNAD